MTGDVISMPQRRNEMLSRQDQIKQLEKDWAENPRWLDVKRGYTAEDVVRLRGPRRSAGTRVYAHRRPCPLSPGVPGSGR
jgi:hypothetical protein